MTGPLERKVAAALRAEVLSPQEAAARPPGSLRALLCRGTPTPAQWTAIAAALLPGALLALYPDDPVGAEAACAAEDAGLEVWDAILCAPEPGDLLPARKPTRKERDFGLAGVVTPRAGHEAVKRQEGSAGTRNARAGAGRSARAVLNDHPTCKPVAVMRAAAAAVGVSDPGARGPVLDLFAGSGATGMACAEDGIPVVLVEKKPRFAAICEARVRGAARVRTPLVRTVRAADLGITGPVEEGETDGADDLPSPEPRGCGAPQGGGVPADPGPRPAVPGGTNDPVFDLLELLPRGDRLGPR